MVKKVVRNAVVKKNIESGVAHIRSTFNYHNVNESQNFMVSCLQWSSAWSF